MKFGFNISKVLSSIRTRRSSNKDESLSSLSPPVPSPPPPTPPVVSCPQCSCRSYTRLGQRGVSGCAEEEVYPSVEVVPAYLWRKEDMWHVVVNPRKMQVFSPRRSKIDSDDGGDLFPPLSIPKPSYRKSKNEHVNNNEKKNRRKRNLKKKKKKQQQKNKKRMSSGFRARVSNSSTDTRLFSTDDDENRENDEECDFEEAETLIYSSNSFSTDAERQSKLSNHQVSPEKVESSPDTTIARSLSSSSSTSSSFQRRRLRWMSSSCVGYSVRESFAVVMKSDHPYEDFRRSITEMVVQKHIYELAELEELLCCLLSLNCVTQHRTIFRAFSEVCHALHSDTPSLPVGPPPVDAASSPLFVNKSMTC